MSSDIDVSVIVPVFNQEKLLPRCMDSILSQKCVSMEVICVNDGSTDDSLSVLKRYQDTDERVKLIDQPNMGVGFSRNVGIDAANGEFVVFCDSDDRIPSVEAYQKLFHAAIDHDVLISAGSFSILENDADEAVIEFDGLLDGYNFAESGLLRYEDYQFDYGFMRFMLNREFLNDNNLRFEAYVRYEDPVFLAKALCLAEEFYAIPDVVYEYYLGHQTFKWDKRKMMDLLAGLSDNLVLSSQNGLWKLHGLTVKRAEEEYGGLFVGNDVDAEVLSRLLSLNSKIDWTHVREDERLLAPLRKRLEDGVWAANIVNTNAFQFARYITAIPRLAAKRLALRREKR